MGQERMLFRSVLVKFENSKLELLELTSPPVAADPDAMPIWRKALEHFEKDRAGDVLPALLAPKIPGANPPAPPVGVDPEQLRAWRKAKAETRHERSGAAPPPLPPPATGSLPAN